MEDEGITTLPAIWRTSRIWPRRLLDTTTMTSVERQAGNIYNGVQEPKYSILSYTWGRFAASPGSPSLAVKGLNWDIPAIDKTRAFSVDAFRNVLRQVSQDGNSFVWLDVACIDQKDYEAKMEEIGRQAGIFANADRAYVWLWSLPAFSLKSAVEPVLKYGFKIGEQLLDWDHDDIPRMARLLSQGVELLLRDSWFSSLWTLQEGFLRDDAILLSREGETVHNPRDSLDVNPKRPEGVVTLADWTARLRLAYEFLTLQPHGPFHHPDCEDLNAATASRIEESGYVCERSLIPNVQYGMARSRQTTLELDRIYGIMAAYNIQVGAAVPRKDPGEKSKDYTLAELQLEFAVAVNRKSALLGQLFVHIRRPEDGKSWMITEHSRVPEGYAIDRLYEGQYVTWRDCRIEQVAGGPGMSIRGVACLLNGMRGYWDFLNQSALTSRFWISVDDYLLEELPGLPRLSPRKAVLRTVEEMQKMKKALEDVYKKRSISVVQLGRVDIEVPSLPALVPEDSRHTTYGLLILHDEKVSNRCQRLGICKWVSETSPEFRDMSIPQIVWGTYEGMIV